MATWAIGDVQGCHDELTRLIEKLRFDPDYAELRRCSDLRRPGPDQRSGLVALIAARLGRTRLIDNLEIDAST